MSSIEFAVVEKSVIDGLKRGNEVLRDIQKELSMESVEKLMEETREAINYQQQIDTILSGKLDDHEQMAVEEEYAKMVKELQVAVLPTPPSTVLPPSTTAILDKERHRIALPND